MPKFNVQMTRLAVVFREEEIEADDAEAAEMEAMSLFKDEECGWTLDAIYDDGKSHSELSVNEIEELDEEGLPIEGDPNADKAEETQP